MSRFEECVRKGLLRKVEPSVSKAERSIKEAKVWLTEAIIAKGSGAYRAALTSVYLSYFHSARAILIKDGYREKSHFCIGVYLEHYVKEGKLEVKWITIFNTIRTIRNTGQYSLNIGPDKAEIEKHLLDAEEFIDRMNDLMHSS